MELQSLLVLQNVCSRFMLRACCVAPEQEACSHCNMAYHC